MRYRLVALTLLFVLPVMYPLAAPTPDQASAIPDIRPPRHQWDDARLMDLVQPYAILDIGPPPKGKTAEEYCEEQIDWLTKLPGGFLYKAWCDPEVQKLRLRESVRDSVKGKDIYPWLENNIRVTKAKGGRRLRFTFRAGNSAEQAVVINTLLRIYIRDYVSRSMKGMETILRRNQEAAPLAKLFKDEQDVNIRMKYLIQRQESLAQDAQFRDDIARLKHVAVIIWAK